MLCEKCGEKETTVNWVGHGSVMDYIHGMYSRWCEYCAVEYQLKHNRKLLEGLPEKISNLEQRFRELKKEGK
jgi:hypothetical protein